MRVVGYDESLRSLRSKPSLSPSSSLLAVPWTLIPPSSLNVGNRWGRTKWPGPNDRDGRGRWAASKSSRFAWSAGESRIHGRITVLTPVEEGTSG